MDGYFYYVVFVVGLVLDQVYSAEIAAADVAQGLVNIVMHVLTNYILTITITIIHNNYYTYKYNILRNTI